MLGQSSNTTTLRIVTNAVQGLLVKMAGLDYREGMDGQDGYDGK